MMVGPLLLIMVFAFACSMAYVARIISNKGLKNSHDLSMLLAVFGGWFPFVLLANNYGNLSILSFSPALFGIALDRRIVGFARYCIPALLSAAAIYIYPEMCILVIAAFFIAGTGEFFSGAWRQKAKLWLGVIIVILLLINLYLPDALHIFSQQLAISKPLVGGRPGNGFAPDLLIMSRLPAALWGFEQIAILDISTVTAGLLLGCLLALIAVFGLVRAIQEKLYTLALFLAVTVGLVTVMIVSKHYDYGAYKMLLLGWWMTSLLVSIGARCVWSAFRESEIRIGAILRVLIAGILFSAMTLWGNQQLAWMKGFNYKRAQPLREVRDYISGLHQVVGASLSDPILDGWMVFELRKLPVWYSEYNGYMGQAHVLPFMARSSVPQQSGDYLLVGKATLAVGKVVWSNGLFSILKNGEGSPIATIGKIEAPNGVERVDGSTFFWLGRNPAVVSLNSTADQTIFLHTDVIGGSSVGDWSNPVAIEIYIDGVQSDRLDISSQTTHSIRLNLHVGSNNVVFKPAYSGGIVPNPNGDSRILIAGIELRKLEFFK
ncbi:hypothetical protein RHOFW104T7_08395 [Rhodanobacter thiooxydans]|uniref:Uncharacterized protein n=2 Tax=Rhodanobacter thiooxydans TaxID=416169 RepID=A0A154QK36_9GAMM|nr:hypothetical protein RHOFW104T7_08395 [Rhodanobacter thiooxydans]